MRLNNEVDTDKVEPGGREYIEPGKYHVEITEVGDNDKDANNPFFYANLTVRAGTNPGMVNKVGFAKYSHYSKSKVGERMNQEMICLFAIQAGVATREEIRAMATDGEVVFDWTKALNKHVIVEFENQTDKDDKTKVYKGKIKHLCVFAIDDPRMADVPKDKDAVQLADAAEMF